MGKKETKKGENKENDKNPTSLREYLLVLKIHKKWINPKIHITKAKIKPLPFETKDRGAQT